MGGSLDVVYSANESKIATPKQPATFRQNIRFYIVLLHVLLWSSCVAGRAIHPKDCQMTKHDEIWGEG